MRILILAPYLTRDQAGAGQSTLTFANSLAKEPWTDVTLYTYAWDHQLLHDRIHVIEGSGRRPPPFFWRFPTLYRVRQMQSDMLRKRIPIADVVYTQNMYMAIAYRRIHPHVPIVSHTGAVVTAREIREEWSSDRWACSIEAALADSLEASSYAEPNWTHIVSTPLVAEARVNHFRLATDFFRVCPLGVDPRRFRSTTGGAVVRAQLGIPQDAFLLITTARLIAWKRIDLVLDALHDLPERVWYLIVGDGSQRPELHEKSEELGVAGRVRFSGWQDPAPYLAAANVFALLSRIESFGLVYVEAMMAGLPCIGSRHRPPDVLSTASSIIPENEAGYTVDSVEEFRDRVLRLMADPPLYGRMSDNARRIANEQYSTDNYLRDFKQCLSQDFGLSEMEVGRGVPDFA